MQSTVSGSETSGLTLLALQLTQFPSFGASDTVWFDGDDFETNRYNHRNLDVLVLKQTPSAVSVLQTAGSM